MNLVIDIGNTLSKVAVIEGDVILHTSSFNSLSTSDIGELLKKYPDINRAILSSVGDEKDDLEQYLDSKLSYFIRMSHETAIPIINRYDTPDTLGMDRIVGAVGANSQFPQRDILLFDLGSAITIDFISFKGEYEGGNISPGMEMRFKSLHHFTNKLPLCYAKDEKISLIGKNSENAIRNGVVIGITSEIDAYIDKFREKNREIMIIFTGGDAKYFVYKVKNAIFVDYDLLLKGLNKILEFNYDKNESI